MKHALPSAATILIEGIVAVFIFYSCSKEKDTGFDKYGICPPDCFRGYAMAQDDYHCFFKGNEDNIAIALEIALDTKLNYGVDYNYKLDRLKSIVQFTKKDPSFMRDYYAPAYVDAGIMSEVTVHADKSIFGRPAGEDISDHIIVARPDKNAIIKASFPDFVYLGKNYDGMPLREYFQVGTAVHSDYCTILSFDRIPDDMPDDFTLTMKIPVDLNESWLTFLDASKYADNPMPPDTYIYTSSVRIQKNFSE